MKKVLFYSALAVTLGLTACSQDEFAPASGADGNVTLTVSLPGSIGTRAFADGLTADDLEMAVYDAETNALVQIPDARKFGNALQTTVNFNLANGRAYKIAFFAHKKDGGAYTFLPEDAKITVDYDKMASNYNTDAHDCFYKLYTTEVITGPIAETIVLTRPVAQVNWGTSDIAHPGVVAADAYGKDDNGEARDLVANIKSVTAFTEFDMIESDVVEGSQTEVELGYIARPQGESFPVQPETYTYLSMSYLLMPAAGTNADLTLDVKNLTASGAMSTVLVTNAPLQANYRTNIYGALLTSPAEFTVVKEPNFTDENQIPANVTSEALTAGGIFNVTEAVDALNIPASPEAPLTLVLNAPVGKISFPESLAQPVTIEIGKDVVYPEFAFTSGSELKDLTIKGDPTSSESFKGFVFLAQGGGQIPVTHTVRPKSFENLTLDGLRFDNGSFAPQYVVSTKNTVVRNCVFLNMRGPAVAIQHAQGGTMEDKSENITIEDCTVEFAADAPSSQNGLYLLDITGNIIVKRNTIKGSTAHGVTIDAGFEKDGVTIARASKIDVSNNTISDKTRDGIKITREIEAVITVNDNTISVKENGIRIKDSIDGNTLTITGNKIDMKNAIDWNESDGEPCAVLLYNGTANTTPANLTVKGNNVSNSNGHDLSVVRVNKTDNSVVE